MGSQIALRVHRGGHGVVRSLEGDEEGVALGVGDPTAVGGECGEQDLLVRG
jgi:hypothetical protein